MQLNHRPKEPLATPLRPRMIVAAAAFAALAAATCQVIEAGPGEPVDGPEQWLYPLQAPDH